MNTNKDKYFQKCVDAGLCVKGQELWNKDEKLLAYAKQECEFLIKNKPLTYKEMLDMYSYSYLVSNSIYISNQIDTLINTNTIEIKEVGYSLILNCTGRIRIYEPNNVVNIANDSNLDVDIYSEGVVTLRVFTDSKININLKNNCSVIVFLYGGKVEKVTGNSAHLKNITLKDLRKKWQHNNTNSK